MLFSSFTFIFAFLPLTIFCYYILPDKIRNVFLLCASLCFYAWGDIGYLALLLISIFINYLFAMFLSSIKEKSQNIKRIVLWLCILFNVGLLFYFKYFNFALSLTRMILHMDIQPHSIVLPIGISFYTFQGLSYVIDVYRQKVPANKNLLELGLYISLFPQLVAGPIVKYQDVYQQIKHRVSSIPTFAYGIERFIFGLTKKVMISNVLGEVTDKIFQSFTSGIDTPTAWLGILCYTFQIYFDFSGYSDMAIGLGRMFGFDFRENFSYPYTASSIQEFWRRWHISLSSWFKEYVYIPLGGSRKGNVYINLFIVFCITGLWHGAALTFIVWGLWHGIFVMLDKFIKRNNKLPKIPIFIQWFMTMFIVVIGWVFFRSSDLSEALHYLKVLFGFNEIYKPELTASFYLDGRILFTFIIAIIFSTPIFSILNKKWESSTVYYFIKVIWLCILFIFCIIYLVNSTYNPFIYFQF